MSRTDKTRPYDVRLEDPLERNRIFWPRGPYRPEYLILSGCYAGKRCTMCHPPDNRRAGWKREARKEILEEVDEIPWIRYRPRT